MQNEWLAFEKKCWLAYFRALSSFDNCDYKGVRESLKWMDKDGFHSSDSWCQQQSIQNIEKELLYSAACIAHNMDNNKQSRYINISYAKWNNWEILNYFVQRGNHLYILHKSYLYQKQPYSSTTLLAGWGVKLTPQ